LLQEMLRGLEGTYGAVCSFRWKRFRMGWHVYTII